MNIAIIPARSGSKRLPDKNIKLVAGYPLIYFTMIEAMCVPEINKIILSTDSEGYVETLLHLNFPMKWDCVIRPKEISGDHSTSEEVVLHVLEKIDTEVDNIVLMQPTNPLFDHRDVSKAIEILNRNNPVNSVFTIEEINRFSANDLNTMIVRPRTQDKVPMYFETGCFWVFRKDEFLKTKNRIIEPSFPITVSKTSALEIDTKEDFDIIEPLLEKKVRQGYYYTSRNTGKIGIDYYKQKIDPDGVERNLDDEEYKKEFCKEEIAFINGLESGRLLDLGCGYGSVLKYIHDRFDKHGLDIDENLRESILRYTKNVHIGPLLCQTYPKGYFDIVLCHHVIEHVIDPVNFIENIRYVLRTHGNLVISTPNFGSALAERFGENYRMLHDQTHISLFTDRSFEWFLRDNGFCIDKISFPFFDTKYFTKDNLMRLFNTNKMSPPFYGNIMTFYCRKK